MRRIGEVFPGPWDHLSTAVRDLRANLFGETPPIDAIDISGIDIPRSVLSEIQAKNLRLVRDEIRLDEMSAEGSPYRTDAYFDDQLLEVVASIAHKYHPVDFIRQMVNFIEIFLNENAAFRACLVVSRIKDEDADRIVELVRTARERGRRRHEQDPAALARGSR